MQVIEKTPEGHLTDEQSEKFMLQIADVTRKAFAHFGEMTAENTLMAFRKPTENEVYAETVNKIFQDVIDADMPSGFNDYIQSVSIKICEKAFQEVAKKNNDNLEALMTAYTGIPYQDLSPKDAVAKLSELEKSN